MAMAFEVYAYWNTDELAATFNAIAAITNSGDFLGLLKTLILIGVLSIAITVLAGRGHLEELWKWFFMVAIFQFMMMVPKADVIIVDRTGTAPTQTVGNVPLGLASFAHVTSKIGDWLTTGFETVFALPSDIQFRNSGSLFGHRVLQERIAAKSGQPILTGNFFEFYRECVTPEIIAGTVNMNELIKSNDIWSYLGGKTNPSLLVTIRDTADPTSISTVGCTAAYATITAQLAAEATAQQGLLGLKMYPGMAPALSNSAIAGSLASSTQYLLGLTSAASDSLRQAIVMNAVIDASYTVPTQLGDAASAATNYAQAAAIRQTSDSYKAMAKVAEGTMPKVRNAIELIQYAVFPIILLLTVVAGHHGLSVLKMYAGSLIWIQLWPPLYAIMNFLMTFQAQKSLTSATNGLGEALVNYSYLNNAVVSDQAIAGMLVLSIPVIAAKLTQWGAHGVESVGSSFAPRGAEKTAEALAQGNITQGSATIDSQSYNNLNGGHFDNRPTVRTGGSDVSQHGGYSVFTAPDGTQTLDAGGIKQSGKLNFDLKTSDRASSSFLKQSEQAETAAAGEMIAAGTSTAAALQQTADLVRSHGKGESAGTRFGAADQSGVTQAVSQAEKATNAFATKHGLSQGQAAEVLALAEASVGTPGALPVSIKAGARATGKSSAAAQQMLEDAKSFVKESGYSRAVDTVKRFSKEASFATSDESGRKAMEGIRASLDQSRTHTDQASANHQRSLAYKESASQAKERAASFDSSATRQFLDYMRVQHNPISGRAFDDATIVQMQEKNPELLEPFKDQFFKDRIEPQLGNGMPGVLTEAAVRSFHEGNKGTLSGAEDVRRQGQTQINDVKAQAARSGVSPDSRASSNLPGQVAAEQSHAQHGITNGKAGVESQGRPIEQQAHDRTAPGSQALLGLAASNAVAQILPDSVSGALMSKIPGLDMSVGTPGASVAEAGAARSDANQDRNPVYGSIVQTGKVFEEGVATAAEGGANFAAGLVRSAAGEEKYLTDLVETPPELPITDGTKPTRSRDKKER